VVAPGEEKAQSSQEPTQSKGANAVLRGTAAIARKESPSTPGMGGIFPTPKLKLVVPKSRPANGEDVFRKWHDSDSNLLILSGPSGAGKHAAVEQLKVLFPDVRITSFEGFPGVGQSLSDISRVLQSGRYDADAFVITTQLEVGEEPSPLKTYLLNRCARNTPWIAVLEPISIPEITALLSEHRQVRRTGIESLLKIDRIDRVSLKDRNTKCLRTPEALHVLADARYENPAQTTVTRVISDYVDGRLSRVDDDVLGRTGHEELLQRICYLHFMGKVGASNTGAVRSIDLAYMSEMLPHPHSNSLEVAAIIAEQSPFLTLQLGTGTTRNPQGQLARLPDTLIYEYFCAGGMKALSDGLILVFLQALIADEHHDAITATFSDTNSQLSNLDRMFLLYLQEDTPSFADLLQEQNRANDYFEWLRGFRNDTTRDPFFRKIAAYQLLAHGDFRLHNYMKLVNRETDRDRSLERLLESERGAGDIDAQLQERLSSHSLRNCRGVTAARMGQFGSLQCAESIAAELAYGNPDDDEKSEFVKATSNLVRRFIHDI
jgi:hypothetical protein